MAERLTLRRRRRRLAALLLVLLVTALHGWIASRLEEDRLGWGSADESPKRLEVSFVHELEPTAPPAASPRPARPPARRPKAAPVQPAASAPEPVSEPEPERVAEAVPPEQPASAPEPTPPAASAAVAAAQAAASAPAGPAFEWPPSTELSYELTGQFRGPVNGTAHVRWIREGTHYQVHLDVSVGLVGSRKMTSDGELTEHGLSPRRYEQLTRVGFNERREALVFEPTHIVLANGALHERLPGVQDTASQLVQLTWFFTTRPDQLQTGRSIELPIALPRRVDRWVYDVLETDTLYTPFGEVQVVHVKPRSLKRRTNELLVEAWFAPGLQYLPARIRIEQTAEIYMDLMLQRKPRQAGGAAAPAPAPSRPYSPPRPTIGDL